MKKYLIIQKTMDDVGESIIGVTVIPFNSDYFSNDYIMLNKIDMEYDLLLNNLRDGIAEYYVVNVNGRYNKNDPSSNIVNMGNDTTGISTETATIDNIKILLENCTLININRF